MLKRKIAAAGLAIVLATVVFVASRPDKFHVERSAQVEAPPEVAFALINDFHQWQKWSPFEKLDPNLKRTFEGAASGEGAVYAWAGNDQAGEGRMTIEESKPGELVSIKLEFIKPFAATNQATFTLVPSGTGTKVTWSMDGKNDILGKTMSLFMDMDKMCGSAFEEGLANLNTASQGVVAQAGKSEAVAKSTPPAGDVIPAVAR